MSADNYSYSAETPYCELWRMLFLIMEIVSSSDTKAEYVYRALCLAVTEVL